jgi:hypothetical protein
MLVLDYLQMKEASLPVRYLGVPLISKKLSATNCSILIEKVSGRNNSWISKKLSFADRLQLISSILFSVQVYWSSIFILRKKIIRLLEQKFNRFLLSSSNVVKARAKVSWNWLCVPKREGKFGD